MTLSASLKFVQGAVRRNKISPELEHYQIENGRVVGFNGYMALSSPIDLDLKAYPKADLFFKAIETCGETITLEMAENGRLSIRSGTFSAYVPCVDEMLFGAAPEGEVVPAPPGLGAVFRRLYPLVSEDASRPWAMGLCSHGGCLQATNNIIIIQEWVGPLPEFNCPRFAVGELARLREDPISLQVSPDSITFNFADGRWLKTQQLSDQWPQATVNKIFEGATLGSPIPPGLFEGLKTIAPFAPANTTLVALKEGRLETGDGIAGAAVEIPGLEPGPGFSAPMLALLEDLATTLDLAAYPKPCGFGGKNLRGVILGLRV